MNEVEPYEEVYQRRFSIARRFLKILTSPSEAMKDIALAPSYGGITVIVVGEIILISISAAIILQKIQILGSHSEIIMDLLSIGLMLSPFLGGAFRVFKWAVKALIVRYTCDCGSSWSFKTAASITGYSYIAGIILGIPGILLGWFLLPTFYIDTSNLEVARQSLYDYQAQFTVLQLQYTLPLMLLELAWKSYLGGLGSHFGTDGRCSLSRGIVVFFGLGLISILIGFFI